MVMEEKIVRPDGTVRVLLSRGQVETDAGITDPFLALMRNVYWKDDLPTLNEGAFAVTWTLEHAIETNLERRYPGTLAFTRL